MSSLVLRPLGAGVLALATLFGASGLTTAADDVKTPAANPAKTGQKLDDAGLLTMLENMGYTPKVVKSTKGGDIFHIKIAHQDLTYTVTVSLSVGDQQNLWLQVQLNDKLPSDGKISSDRLLKLMQLNDELGPTHFYITKSGRLYIAHSIGNRDVTAVVLRKNLDLILNDCAQTRPHWQVQDWTVPAAATAAAPAK